MVQAECQAEEARKQLNRVLASSGANLAIAELDPAMGEDAASEVRKMTWPLHLSFGARPLMRGVRRRGCRA